MATVAAGSKTGGRGCKALTAVLDNDANISAGKADVAAALLSPPQRAKRASSKVGKGKAAAEAPSMAEELTELQGMLERPRLEKEKAEEMVRERDEVIRKKEEIETRGKEQELLQAELKKMQRFKDSKPTVSFPLVKSLLDKDQEGDDKGKKKYGRIVDIDLKIPPRPPGYAFVEFEDPRDAEDAIHGRDGYNFDGNRLRVEIAHGGRGNSSSFSNSYGGGGRHGGVSRHSEYRVLVTGLPSSASWQDLKDHMRKASDVCYSEVYREGSGLSVL